MSYDSRGKYTIIVYEGIACHKTSLPQNSWAHLPTNDKIVKLDDMQGVPLGVWSDAIAALGCWLYRGGLADISEY